MLSRKQGDVLVKFARNSIKQMFEGKGRDGLKNLGEFSKKHGVFVTLLSFPSHELRGCIGFPYPNLSLDRAVKEAAIAAAFSDCRFQPLQKNELKDIIIEISMLTIPEEIKCKKNELQSKIKIGQDGLIISYKGQSGLLLPQVPVEWGWDSHEFLEQICMKAGLDKKSWKQKDCKIYNFQAQIFSEEKPEGKII